MQGSAPLIFGLCTRQSLSVRRMTAALLGQCPKSARSSRWGLLKAGTQSRRNCRPREQRLLEWALVLMGMLVRNDKLHRLPEFKTTSDVIAHWRLLFETIQAVAVERKACSLGPVGVPEYVEAKTVFGLSCATFIAGFFGTPHLKPPGRANLRLASQFLHHLCRESEIGLCTRIRVFWMKFVDSLSGSDNRTRFSEGDRQLLPWD
jgi:hypothetical protein